MKKLGVIALSALIATTSFAADNKKDWKLHAELSYVVTSGNTKTQTFASKVEGQKEAGVNRFSAKFDGLFARAQGTETANRWYLLGKWERTFSERMFGFLQGDYLKDRFAGFDYRITLTAGLGYDIVKTDKHYLKGLFSLGYATQTYENGDSDNYPTANLGLNYTWQILENLKFKEDFNYQTSLSDTSLYYINSDTSVQVKINTHFSLGVGLRIAYQNQPPTNDIKKTDTTFLTSLIIDY